MANKKRAIFLDDDRKQIDVVYSQKTKKQLFEKFDFYPEIISSDELESKKDITICADYIFSTWGMPAISGEDIDKYFPSVKAVFYAAGSVQGFARPFLEKGIAVSSAWMANGVPVAEYTVSQIVLANKGFFTCSRRMKEQRRFAKDTMMSFPCNYDVNVGLIGVGAIGSMVAQMLKGYNMNVYVYDIFLSDERAAQYGVTKADLPFIFKNCQTVSNHLANNAQTVGILDYSLFSLMPDNGTFINTGRGAQVVEKDLIRALKEKPGRTAILDVTFPEPINEENSELYDLENVILTPHIAGSTNNECFRMAEYMLAEAMLFEAGQPLKYGVTLEMLKTMA